MRDRIASIEEGYSLGIYRVTFGILMSFSLLRFIYNGWVEACYLSPDFHFKFQYFRWVSVVDNPYVMYTIVSLAALSALLMAFGLWYRLASISFFLLFTYLELLEKSWYLNHYYFVSIIAFLLIFIPADNRLSIISRSSTSFISTIYRNVLKLQISMVYFFAGIAKINKDWMVDALPLRIWLQAKGDIPFIGDLLTQPWLAYLFSYSGMVYDILIPFLLWYKNTRKLALLAVIAFHLMTGILFPIGLFPYIMIVGSLIFLDDEEWKTIFSKFNIRTRKVIKRTKSIQSPSNVVLIIFLIHFLIQIIIPLRHHFYNENTRWTERGYRFSWNVMLIEKGGFAVFKVSDIDSDKTWTIYPSDYLTEIQEKQMSFQADMVWEFAQHIGNEFAKKGYPNVKIFVINKVAFNGRPSQSYIPSYIDLLHIREDEIYNYIENLKF